MHEEHKAYQRFRFEVGDTIRVIEKGIQQWKVLERFVNHDSGEHVYYLGWTVNQNVSPILRSAFIIDRICELA